MSEQKTPRIWMPVTIDAKETRIGELLRFSANAKQLIEWINANTNERGWINATIGKNKPGSKHTHSAWLDTFKPRQAEAPSEPATDRDFDALKGAVDNGANDAGNDDVPF